MAAPVVHFEIGSMNSAETARFYAAVFGWHFAGAGAALTVAGGHEGGPTGMLNALGHPPENYVLLYVQVDDIEAALARSEAAGGTRLVGPIALPDGRRFAWVRDTAGNMVGLLTPLHPDSYRPGIVDE
jgi:predicted enzyme related to lactoylglutathione lyase